jgi:hypothetical protein
MARSTSTKEASIVAYFQNAPLAVANTVFGIVRGTMKGRNASIATPATPKKKAVRRSRVKKVVVVAPAPPVAAEPVTAVA